MITITIPNASIDASEQLFGLALKVLSKGARNTPADSDAVNYDIFDKHCEMLTKDVWQLLASTYCAVTNLGLWFEVADLDADVPDGIVGRSTIDDEGLETILTWTEWMETNQSVNTVRDDRNFISVYGIGNGQALNKLLHVWADITPKQDLPPAPVEDL